jgi:hypothetical protein
MAKGETTELRQHHFGLGTAAGKVDHRAAYGSCGLLLLTLILEVALSSR